MKRILVYVIVLMLAWSCNQQGSEKTTESQEEAKQEEKKPSDYDKPELAFTPTERKNKLVPVKEGKEQTKIPESLPMKELKEIFDIAVDNLKKGNYELSINGFDQVIAQDPKNKIAYYNRGIAYFSLKAYDNAMKDFSRVTEMNPRDTSAFLYKGLILYNQQDYNGAVREYGNAIKNGPNYATAYYNRGIAWGQLKSYDKAVSDFDKALSVNPNNDEYLFNKGLASYFNGDTISACQTWKRASNNGYEKATKAVAAYCK